LHPECGAMKNNKIVSLENLEKIIAVKKSNNKRVVLCHGVFDLLHIGHIKHFEEAKKLGDVLIVSVTPDKFVNKGPNRPAFKSHHRLEALAALESIDYIVENKWNSAVNTIKFLKPNIYCKGPDYKIKKNDITGKIRLEEKAIKLVKGRIKYTTDITFSSSELINKYGNLFNDNQSSLIKKLNIQYGHKKIIEMINNLKDLKVLLIGEAIIDQYVFCEALGKSGKEPVLVMRDIETQQYAGGAAAIARHLSDFCKSINLVSLLGEKKEYEKFIKKSLPKNVKTNFIYKTSSPTIVKKRYVDHINNNKILGVYSINDEKLDNKNEKTLEKIITNLIPKFDLVIVSDFGHGFISQQLAKKISNKSKFTSLNAQINAANIGYQTMENYKNVDCVIINENELRHQLRSKDKPLNILMKDLSYKLKTKNVVVTQGNSGAILYNTKKNKIYSCPAFASKVVDKIGAGDAMLSLLSLCLQKGYGKSFSLFVASLAAAQSVESIGNSKPVNKKEMIKTIEHILK